MKKFHIAQINIARGVAPLESKEMEGFVNRLDKINAMADSADGFVWRLQEENGNATSIQAYRDPNIIVNMSVWESIEALRNFVFKTAHVELIRERHAWFKKMDTPHLALWWIPVGHIPSVEEGKEKLDLLDKMGPSQDAFTFARPFEKYSK